MLASGAAASADQTVQIPIDALLNGRSVSTLTQGAVVPWVDGVDQNDGLMTTAAEMSLHQSGTALPDDGVFPADNGYPEVALHFSNAAPATDKQIFYLHGTGTFDFAVPPGNYTRLFLFLLSSFGDSPLTVTMTYADATTTAQSFTLPDWGTGAPLPKDPPIFFNLISGMHKWDKQDDSVDTPSHTITGVELAPAADKTMTKVHVDKPNAGQYLIFWGATGVATNVVDRSGDYSDGSAGANIDAGVPGAGVVIDAGASGTGVVIHSTPELPAEHDAGAGAGASASAHATTSYGAGTITGSCALGGRRVGASGWPLLLATAAAVARRRVRRQDARENLSARPKLVRRARRYLRTTSCEMAAQPAPRAALVVSAA